MGHVQLKDFLPYIPLFFYCLLPEWRNNKKKSGSKKNLISYNDKRKKLFLFLGFFLLCKGTVYWAWLYCIDLKEFLWVFCRGNGNFIGRIIEEKAGKERGVIFQSCQ